MKLPPFKLDHWLAAHEFAEPPIRFNLASSTGPQWTLHEILALGGSGTRVDDVKLSYAPPQGGLPLRERIAALHGVSAGEVLAMTGASEALTSLVCHFAPEPGGASASIVLPKPCYPAVPVLARAWGLRVKEYELQAPLFAQTAELVMSAVDDDTRAVFVNSPHNPTGAVMSVDEQVTLAGWLENRGIPLIVDEVYHPLYFSGQPPSAAALRNTIVLGDFAKALSVPGLRIGWLIDRDPVRREALLDARSYLTISGSPVTEAIGTVALEHAEVVWARLRETASANLERLESFMREHSDRLEFVKPAGGTTCFPRLRDGSDARPLCEHLAKAGVLVAPGDCFDAPAHMRIGFGAQREGYGEALALFANVLRRH